MIVKTMKARLARRTPEDSIVVGRCRAKTLDFGGSKLFTQIRSHLYPALVLTCPIDEENAAMKELSRMERIIANEN